MNKRIIHLCCIVLLVVMLLAGCGGGGGSSTTTTISGVAAAGSPLSGTAYLKDSSSPARELSAPIASDGSFSFNLDGLTAPFLLKAVGVANGNNHMFYSFATAAGVANINPLSHLAVVAANSSDDLTGLYNAPDPIKMHAIRNALPNAVASVQSAFQPTLAKFGAADVNFISDPYVANHQGLDLFLDMADISTGNGVMTIIDKPANNAIQMPFSDFMTGSIDIIAIPVAAAGSVCIWPSMPSVEPNGTVTFTAVVIGTANQEIIWSMVEENGGTITNTGVYTAPATAGTYHIKATSAADTTKSATATVVVGAMNALRITPSGPGVFSVQAAGLVNVGTIMLTITYDPSSLVNPKITLGAMAAGGMMAVNTRTSGEVRWAFVTVRPISGSGTLATISFDVLGSLPGVIHIMSASLTDGEGRPIATTAAWTNPTYEASTPPAEPSSSPSVGNEGVPQAMPSS